jgi:hypothetical protein
MRQQQAMVAEHSLFENKRVPVGHAGHNQAWTANAIAHSLGCTISTGIPKNAWVFGP